MTHLEKDPLEAHDRGRLGDQVPPDRVVPEARRPAAHAPAGRRCSTSRTTTSPARGRSTTCSSGASRSSASSPTRRSPTRSTRRRRRTRARLRGAFIKRAKERKRDYTVDWVHLKLNDQAQRTVLCKDPFKSRDERVERLIASPVARGVPMPSFRAARVAASARERPGCSASRSTSATAPSAAYVLTQLTGRVDVGDAVVVNTTAVELGLGTGGWHVVHWNLARDEWSEPGPGHIIKARYTSLQADVGSTEEHWPELADVTRSTGMPVVAAALHSQLPAIAVAFKQRAARRSARVRHDRRRRAAARALRSRRRSSARATSSTRRSPAATRSAATTKRCRCTARSRSRTHIVARRRGGRRDGAGHRRHRDPARVLRHRGRARSSTRPPACGGVPIACLRASFADPRERHRGVSHHSVTALTIATRSSRARPARRPSAATKSDVCAATSTRRASTARHEIVDVAPVGIVELLDGARPRTSSRWAGRRRDDPVLFEAAAAAGSCAAAARPAALACRRCPTRPVAVERVLNLLALLLDTRVPLTREEIVREVAGYPPQQSANRRAFERDKEDPARHGRPDHDRDDRRRAARSATASGPTTTTCPTSISTPTRRAALRVAVSAISLGNQGGEGALMKLGGVGGEVAAPIASLPIVPALATLFEAFRRRAVVTFAYRGETPHASSRGACRRSAGHWYVVGYDRDRDAIRAFRADRIDGDVDVGAADAFDAARRLPARRPHRGPAVDARRRRARDRPAARRRRPRRRARSPSSRGDATGRPTGPTATVDVELTVTNRAAFRVFVLGFLDHAEVLGPPDVRADVVALARDERAAAHP